MTVLQIQCFLTVCRCRKYSEAAERLGLPQSALFKQLKAMEDEFSVRLFEKENRGVGLTEAGNALYPHVVCMYAEYKKILGCLDECSLPRDGSLSLGSMYFLKCYKIIQMIRDFGEVQPDIRVSVQEYRSHELEEMMRKGELDGCFAYGELLEETYPYAVPVRHERLCALVSRKHALAGRASVHLSELKDEQFVLMRGDRRIHQMLLGFCLEEGFVPREYNMDLRNATIKELVLYNNWVSLFPEGMADELLDGNLNKIYIEGNKKMTVCFVSIRDDETIRSFGDYIGTFC